MHSSTVRIDKDSKEILRQIAEEENESMQNVIHKALEEYRRKAFLRSCARAYSDLKSDGKAWREEEAERKAWDRTAADGLEGDE